jgi:hypothetical protein
MKKLYQVEITETLRMTIDIEAENAQRAEDMVRKAYENSDYILDADHFAGVEFSTRETGARSKARKDHGQER